MNRSAAISSPLPDNRRLFVWYGLCAAISLFVAAYAWLQIRYQQPSLEKYKALPAFGLIDQDGGPFGSEDLKGKVWLADFVYTTCPGPCPMVSHRLSQLQGEAFKNDDVRFVSFTMDAKTDTPAVLKKYASEMRASPGKWQFLTGDQEKIFDLVRNGFTLVIPNPAEKAPILHSTKLALVDRKGVVRGYYDGIGEDESPRILKDMRRLLQE